MTEENSKPIVLNKGDFNMQIHIMQKKLPGSEGDILVISLSGPEESIPKEGWRVQAK